MAVRGEAGSRTFTNPLPGVALGDPFVLRHRGRFYLYGTNDASPLPDGRAVPVCRSDDLLHWEPLGGALEPRDPGAEHWAPEVLYWNGRFYMVVSFGDVERVGHALWVATADRPEGPFRLQRRVSDPSERFSIDGSWLLDDDGRLYLYRCLDFVAENNPPHGTGIVVQEMRDPLTPAGPPVTVLRAHAPWQLFLANRTMPLYGGRTFAAWNTIEGAAPVRRAGRVFCGYSGGNYTSAYGTGEAVADQPLGPYTDLRGAAGPLFGTVPGLVEGPGHFSVVRPDLVHDWIVLHGRSPGEPVRRVWLCPATWRPEGVSIGPLTDWPQPAPPLPTYLVRFDGPEGPIPGGWHVGGGSWRLDGRGLKQGKPMFLDPERMLRLMAVAWLESVPLTVDWVVEVGLRFPAGEMGAAGVRFESETKRAFVQLDPASGACRFLPESQEDARSLPTLGDEPFNPQALHTIEVRARSGRAEVRVDGVLVAAGLAVPKDRARLGLLASGPAVFDTVSVTSVTGP
jgi:GH43 family beta-xylosidase